jgi:hypothetical protein
MYNSSLDTENEIHEEHINIRNYLIQKTATRTEIQTKRRRPPGFKSDQTRMYGRNTA